MTIQARRQRGFTIVELLIVVVIIAILAAITIVAYNGIQTRATNASRSQELVAWRKHFLIYQGQEGDFPTMPDGSYCLGTGFVGGVCQNSTGSQSWPETASAPLLTQLAKVGSLPSGPRTRITSFGAPYVTYAGNQLTLTGMVDTDASQCPGGSTTVSTYAPLILCRYVLTR